MDPFLGHSQGPGKSMTRGRFRVPAAGRMLQLPNHDFCRFPSILQKTMVLIVNDIFGSQISQLLRPSTAVAYRS